MKYYIDTEFLEGTQKERFPINLFRKETKPTIDLISIGIAAEDGREYYAISKDFNLKEAWNRYDLKPDIDNGGMKKVYWIRENVLLPVYNEWLQKEVNLIYKATQLRTTYRTPYDPKFCYKSFKYLLEKHGKTNKEIAEEIISFTEPVDRYYSLEGEKRFTHGNVAIGKFSDKDIKSKSLKFHYPATNPKFYAYYADYDWVAFCWLFGKMMDLPVGYPKYCNDLKQILDEKASAYIKPYCFGDNQEKLNKMVERSVKGQAESFKTFSNYPKQENEHNALADARWNKKLHEFLNNL